MKKYIRKSFYLFVILSAILLAGISFQGAQVSASIAVYADQDVETMTNNVLFVNFSGEEDITEIPMYQNSYTTFDTLFNVGDTSVKNYYYLNSNGNLNVDSQIFTENQEDILVFTASQPRTYYLPYILQVNGTYQKNADGYFDYMLVRATTTSAESALRVPYSASFFDRCEVIANVYEAKGGVASDNNMQDGIISLDYAQALENSNSNYYIIESPQRRLREYELVSEIYSMASENVVIENSDNNNDGFLDVLSIAVLKTDSSSQYYIEWSTLLWAHQTTLNAIHSNFINYNKTQQQMIQLMIADGVDEQEATRQAQYIYNRVQVDGLAFNTVNFSSYDIENINTQNTWDYFVRDNSTFIHEFGHVLGLRDLYLGSGDATSVGSWSHMCNSVSKSSFFTSYEREKLGWLDEDNIVEITKEGEYALQYVKGIDNDNVVAYKIVDPQKSSRSIYIEYRQTQGYFDSQCGRAGLLVYVVDTQYNGNRNTDSHGNPLYEIYVQRNLGETVFNASVQQGETLDNIIFGIENENINSGIVVEVIFAGDDNVIFQVQGGNLLPQDSYTLADFNNNVLLYNKLMENLPKGQQTLNRQSFVDALYLDLNGINLSDLSFLGLFDLSSIEYINLSDNDLTNEDLTILSQYVQNLNTLKKVYLFANNFDATTLQEYDSKFVFGAFLDMNTTEYFTSVNMPLLLRQDDGIDIRLNGQLLQSNDAIQSITLEGGYYYIRISFSGEVANYFNNNISLNFNVIDITSKYPSEAESYKIYIADDLPDITQFIEVIGAETYQFSFIYEYPQLTYGNGNFEVIVKYNNQTVKTIKIYYFAFEKPQVEFVGGETEYVEFNTTYEDKGIMVYEDGEQVDYTLSSSGEMSTYYIKFIYFGGIFDSENPVLQNGEYVDVVDTSLNGNYIICYSLTNKYGAQFDFYKQVIVTEEMLEESLFDEKLYTVLTGLLNSNQILKTSFLNTTFVDLSNNSLTSIKGLEHLDFSEDTVIDLTSNNLSNIDELENLLNTKDVTVYAMFNRFQKSNVLAFDSIRKENCVFGIQNLLSVKLTELGNNFDIIMGEIFDDFSKFNMSLSFENAKIDYVNNTISLQEAGEYVCSFTYDNAIRSKNVSLIKLAMNENSIVKSYNELLTIDNTLLNVEGVEKTKLNIISDQANYDLTKIGNYEIKVYVEYLGEIMTLNLNVEVVDDIKPTISLDGDLDVYVNSLSMYEQYYKDDIITAYDDYDKQLSYSVIGEVKNEYGIYELTYTASDSSGNSAQLKRIVHIGNVTLTEQQGDIEYNTRFNLEFNTNVFQLFDFNISYKIDSEPVGSSYNGLLLKKFGENLIDVTLTHKLNNDLVINLQYLANVTDTQTPTIELVGSEQTNIKIDQPYIENGIICQDNSIDGYVGIEDNVLDISINYFKLDETSNVYVEIPEINTSIAGDYKIEYTVKDSHQNTSVANRYLTVEYYPITMAQIDATQMNIRYQVGDSVSITLDILDENKTNPNPIVYWYVNDELFQTTYGTSAQFSFDEKGEYNITAYVSDNMIGTQTVTISVYEKNEAENVFMIIGIVAAVFVVLCFAGYFISVYAKRNFY